MHDEWPLLVFPAPNSTVLDLFSSETSEEVASRLLNELVKDTQSSSKQSQLTIESDDQIRWIMQVLNHSLSLPLSTERQFKCAQGAVHSYLHWLKALTSVKDQDPSIPKPIAETPEQYFRNILDALRSIFRRRECMDSFSVERQAGLIESTLDTIRLLTREPRNGYQDEIWSRSLSFSLNCTDLLLSPPVLPGDVSCRIGSSVMESLLSLWMHAVGEERIPSPSYWRTLKDHSANWRHHVTVIESWSRKLLALTVLVMRSIYGVEYCNIPVADESLRFFAGSTPQFTASLSCEMDIDERTKLLHESWTNIFSLIDSPLRLLHHSPSKENGSGDTEGEREQQPLCFFLAVTTIQRMVDLFYGDSRVCISMNECDRYLRSVTSEAAPEPPPRRNAPSDARTLSSLSAGANAVASVSSNSSSSGPSRTNSDMKAHRTTRMSDRSVRGGPPSEANTESDKHGNGGGMPVTRKGEGRMEGGKGEGSTALTASKIVAHSLTRSWGLPPWQSPSRSPRSSRLLELTMPWLMEAASTHREISRKGYGEERHLTDDVISTLSLCSSIDNSEETMMPVERHEGLKEKRSSFGGSVSSASSFTALSASQPTSNIISVDGVEAGRAAAIAALTRIVCAKSSTEVLPTSQLAQYLTLVQQALVNKERLVLCSLVYYGHSLFRLALPAIETLLPHFLFALDIVLIESTKLRLHPSFDPVEMRRQCLRALSTVVVWPTSFGAEPIPQLAENSSLKSCCPHFINLRLRIYKTLIFSLRNETDSFNLQLTLAMVTVLCEEAAGFDLTMSDEEREVLVGKETNPANGATPEKALVTSLVRGVISALCDRLCRPEWNSDFSVSFSALDAFNALSTLPHQILFTNKDLSTGMLIVSSLCRFIETQLGKPPPSHSKDLHSSVVAAFQSLTVWLCSCPLLAECESVLQIVAETIQLGITGTKKQTGEGEEKKAASRRVFDAAEATMNSLFTCLGSHASSGVVDERRLLHLFGPSAIDTTKFQHFLVNGDSILSFHEASHIPNLAKGTPCVLYVRRSPMHMAKVGFARITNEGRKGKDDAAKTPIASMNSLSVSSPLSTSTPSSSSPASTKLTEAYAKAQAFRLPPNFHTVTCKVDTLFHPVESSRESEEILLEMQRLAGIEGIRPEFALSRMSKEERERYRTPTPKEPVKTCNSIRVFLYDMGLINEKSYGKDLVPLDAGQSSSFYRDLHEMVDCSPSSFLSTTHIFYVRNGQRNALDILENGMNLQSLSSEFLQLLSSLGEGVEVGRHEGWTGHWSTAFSSERKPVEERGGVDHYILDGLSHCVYRKEGGTEMAFVLPSQRAVRHFKMEMPQTRSSRSGKSTVSYSQSEVTSPTRTEHNENDDVFVQSPTARSFQPYSGGGSSMGGGSSTRRFQSDVKILLIWVERLEDVVHFPLEDVLCTCDDGGDRASSVAPSSSSLVSPSLSHSTSSHSPGSKSMSASIPFLGIFLHEMESGLVQIRTRSSATRFGCVGPLMDEMVVSVSSLSSLIRFTILNVTRRNIAEVDNYQHTHVKRRQSISEFGKKYAMDASYQQFLTQFILS
ncbi:hypothetical protein PMAYCL1PPCAC_06767 [Pristionchus mayeri]|uniref:Ral GTPase-activating protein subunit alpha/beta N-terminal domain-containing protein n=1 Tax=Pristionchus mayeri TaxID=1317129 RepID=A0AAN5CB46_9BILA|nr:hypothetical protein PMAYCL1PPCAC_06767 [Pristionchus mayeri]